MIEAHISDRNQYRDHLSWIDTLTKRDIIALKINLNTINFSDYEIVLYEYNKQNVPQKRWLNRGKWKKGYTISFDMENDYFIQPKVRYLLTFVFFIQSIEVRYHVFIKI